MSKSKTQKKKDREKESRKKVLRRRKAIRASAKKQKEEADKDREYQKLVNRIEGRTIVNRDPEEQHNLLQHNMDILKALQEQQELLEEKPPVKKGFKASAEVSFVPNNVENAS